MKDKEKDKHPKYEPPRARDISISSLTGSRCNPGGTVGVPGCTLGSVPVANCVEGQAFG